MDAIIEQMVVNLREAFGNDYLLVFFVSMLPTIEVRGAIPIAVSLGMSKGIAYVFTALSALVVAPILFFLFRPLLNSLKKTKWFARIAHALEENFVGKAGKIEKSASNKSKIEGKKTVFFKTLGLYLFVALPLPLTGVWTGSIVAAFLDLDYRYSLSAIVLGNFTAAAIVLLLTYVLGDYSYLIILVLAVFIIISVATLLITMFVKRKSTQNAVSVTDKESKETIDKN
ncbi:MAG: small multi-drug export protein [Clostridia bacterium]|nr:small multi-drug export protein [Clostridia bacterium]